MSNDVNRMSLEEAESFASDQVNVSLCFVFDCVGELCVKCVCVCNLCG